MKFLSIGITMVTMMMPLLVSNVAMAICIVWEIPEPKPRLGTWEECFVYNTKVKEDTETKEVEEKEYEEVFVSELLAEIEKHGHLVSNVAMEDCTPTLIITEALLVYWDCYVGLNTQTKEDTETKEVEEKEYEEVFVSELLAEIERHGHVAYVCDPSDIECILAPCPEIAPFCHPV